NSLVRLRTSTTDTCVPLSGVSADQTPPSPVLVDGVDLRLGVGYRLLGSLLPAGGLGEHHGDDRLAEDLAGCRVGGAGMADVCAPVDRSEEHTSELQSR